MVSWQQQTTQICFGFLYLINSTLLEVLPADYIKKVCQKLRKYGKMCQKMRKYNNMYERWESLPKAEKVWQSVSKDDKVCQKTTKCVKRWQSVSKDDKDCQKMTKCVKRWQSVQQVDKVCHKLTKSVKRLQSVQQVDKVCQKLRKYNKMFQKIRNVLACSTNIFRWAIFVCIFWGCDFPSSIFSQNNRSKTQHRYWFLNLYNNRKIHSNYMFSTLNDVWENEESQQIKKREHDQKSWLVCA